MRPVCKNRSLDLKETPGRESMCEIENQEIAHEEVAQRMAAVGFERPRDLGVKTIKEGKIGVHAGFEERPILSGKCKGVLLVVEIPKLKSSGSRITHWIRHHEVLDLRPPDTFDSDRLSPAGGQNLRDD